MVILFRRHREPNAADLLAYTLAAKDFRSAAVLIAAGAAEVLDDIRSTEAPDTAHTPDRTLALAVQRIGVRR
jgi:hypothetical protein